MNWLKVEKNISNISNFLRKNIHLSPFNQNNPINCEDCLFRLISVLVASDNIKIKKIKYNNNTLWKNQNSYSKNQQAQKPHGADWHNSAMQLIENYFTSNHYSVTREANLHLGKCDLLVTEINTYIEVGTIDLYKLYYNLFYMKNCAFLLVPNNNYCIKFSL